MSTHNIDFYEEIGKIISKLSSNIYNLSVLLFSQSDEDSEPSEEEDRFVAQLYKFCDDRGTPINKAPSVGSKDLNLYKLFKIVQKLGGYNRVGSWQGWENAGIYELSPCHWRLLAFSGRIRHILAFPKNIS